MYESFFSNNILLKISYAKISFGLSNISVTPPKYFSNVEFGLNQVNLDIQEAVYIL